MALTNGSPHAAEVSARVVPHDLGAERAVLSAILLTADALVKVRPLLRPDQFYAESHRRIYEAIISLDDKGTPIDLVTVAGELRETERIAQVGGAAYLAEIIDATPAIANVEAHARIVLDKWSKRQIIVTFQRLAAEGYGDTGDAADYAARARQQIDSLGIVDADHGEVPTAEDPFRGAARLGAVAILGRAKILELAARPVVYIWQDIALAGIIVVVAGGPGSGKTTLLFLVLAARLNLGKAVKVLGREVTPAPAGTFVILIEAEHGDSSTARKLVKSCRLLGVEDDALDRVIVIARRGVRIGSPEWQAVGHMVAAGIVSDIALDTLARVAPGDANDEREQVAIFDQVAQTIERAPSAETRPIVWTVAHTRKAETDDLADVSGSTQRTGQADTVLMMKPEKADGRVTSSRVTFAKLREEPDEYPAPVEYTVTSGAVVDVDRPIDDGRPIEERITERLARGPLTKSALARELKVGKDSLEEPITNLFTAKHIVTTDVTIKGTTYKGFALRPGAAHEPS